MRTTPRSGARCSRSAAGATATATWCCASSSISTVPVRGLIGPWGHTGPEAGRPGPAIGFLQECVRFFAASLDGEENGFFDEPRLISYMQEPVAPAGSYADRGPGAGWPTRRGRRRRASAWDARRSGDSVADCDAPSPPRCAGCAASRPPVPTAASGAATGAPADFALDQRPDDGASLCWDSEPLAERVELLGKGIARLECSVDRPQALVCGARVRRGPRRALDARRPRAPQSQPAGGTRPDRADAGRRAGAGHASHCSRRPMRSRPATASASPSRTRTGRWAWPSPRAVTLAVHGGGLTLPRRTPSELDAQLRPFDAPESGTALAVRDDDAARGRAQRPPRPRHRRNRGEFDWHPSRVRILQTGTEIGEENVTSYRIVEGDPLSATVTAGDVSPSTDPAGAPGRKRPAR